MISFASSLLVAAAPKLNAEGESMFTLDPNIQKFLWIGIGIYIIAMLAIGYFSGRKVKNLGDFLVAGRRLPLWMATAVATMMPGKRGKSRDSRCFSASKSIFPGMSTCSTV